MRGIAKDLGWIDVEVNKKGRGFSLFFIEKVIARRDLDDPSVPM
jgi:hypothetical protein